ncbi:MAG: DUF2785 domain-containing protein [Anaerolineae bacterium]
MSIDAQFWRSIQEHDFAIPDGYALADLTAALIAQIGTPDADLRELTYDILSEWILSGKYTPADLRQLIAAFIANLQIGLGEKDTDSVFTRSFSVLLLGETINYDNEAEYLTQDEVQLIVAAVLDYQAREQDWRDQVGGKGWAHAREHIKLCFTDILDSRYVSEMDKAHIEDILRQGRFHSS